MDKILSETSIQTTAQRCDRLDKVVQDILKCARNQAEQLIESGFVALDGKTATKTGMKVKEFQSVNITLPKAQKKEAETPSFEVEILHEDEEILILNKPSGIVVHPASGTKEPTLVEWLKHKGFSLSSLSGEERCGIVHRLDKETSGVMVVAKNNSSHAKLSVQLQERTMGRYYLAIIDAPLKEHTVVEKPLSRNSNNRLKIGISKDGRYAKSAFAKIATSKNGYELILAKLYTGRTHQIRAHLASINRHILGDTLYGFKSAKITIPRVFLHARVLYLTHPTTQEHMYYTAQIPNDLKEFIDANFEHDEVYKKLDDNALLSIFDSFC